MAKRVPRKLAARINVARNGAQDALEPGFADALLKFFRKQAKFVAANLDTGRKVFTDPRKLLPAEDLKALNDLMLQFETAQWEFTSGVVAPLVDVPASSRLSPKARENLLKRAKGINDYTRQRIKGTIDIGVLSGQTDAEIGREISKVIDNPARARTIARTEMALADQAAATDRYREAGVKAVEVFDGAGCGWTYHDDPDKANGTIRTLRQAESQPLSHPNCRRVFMPVSDVAIPDTSDELAQWQREQQEEWESEGLI